MTKAGLEPKTSSGALMRSPHPQTPSYQVFYFYHSIPTAFQPPCPWASPPSLPWKGTLMPPIPDSVTFTEFSKGKLCTTEGPWRRGGTAWGVSGQRFEGQPRVCDGGHDPGDGQDQGRFGDSPCEDHRGLQRRLGKMPLPELSARWWLPACLCCRGGGQWSCAPCAPPHTPISRPRPRRGRAQAGGQLWGKQ